MSETPLFDSPLGRILKSEELVQLGELKMQVVYEGELINCVFPAKLIFFLQHTANVAEIEVALEQRGRKYALVLYERGEFKTVLWTYSGLPLFI